MVVDDDDDYDDSDGDGGGGGGGEGHCCGWEDFLESHAHHKIIMNSVKLMNDFMDHDGDFWNDHDLKSNLTVNEPNVTFSK